MGDYLYSDYTSVIHIAIRAKVLSGCNDLQWEIVNSWCKELGTYTLYSYTQMIEYVYAEVMAGKRYEELLQCLKSFT